MGHHFQIHVTAPSDGKTFVLLESAYPLTFGGTDTTRPKQFATRGGAKNYVHKWHIADAKIVRADDK